MDFMCSSLDVSVVVSIYNEVGSLRALKSGVSDVLGATGLKFEIILVNDGSNDGSAELIKELAVDDKNVRGILFSRNFGHEAAMIAGVDAAKGRFIVCMDADLQHPPACLRDMLDSAATGFDVILMNRVANEGVPVWKSFTSALFYKTLNRLSKFEFVPNASDFFLISKRVADILRNDFRERNRFLRGFVQIAGFRKTILTYKAEKRNAGASSYSFMKLVRMSAGTLANFSDLPLILSIYLGFVTGIFSLTLGAYSLIKFLGGTPPSGYTTIVVTITFLFSILFVVLGANGFYMAKIYSEVKRRPIYIIEESF